VGDEGLRPQLAQDLDLLLDAPTARPEVFTERVVLDIVPANADAETQATLAQHVDLRRLLGHESGLTLGENENARDQLEPRGHRREKTKEHHGLVKRVLVGVGPSQAGLPGRVSAQYVVIDEQVVIAEPLGRLGVVLDGLGIVAELGLRKHDPVLHGVPPLVMADDDAIGGARFRARRGVYRKARRGRRPPCP
jgi:hypothetical protein